MDIRSSALFRPSLIIRRARSAAAVVLLSIMIAPKTHGATCSTTGAQNIAVILSVPQGTSLPAGVTPKSIYDVFFATAGRSLNGYWTEASYGKATATGNVFGPY